jgi:hypothetical protein
MGVLPRALFTGQARRWGALEAGERLLGHVRAADDVAPLEHQHTQPGARPIAHGHQPVVPAADYDRVVARASQR